VDCRPLSTGDHLEQPSTVPPCFQPADEEFLYTDNPILFALTAVHAFDDFLKRKTVRAPVIF
jgi:hypothetical protein